MTTAQKQIHYPALNEKRFTEPDILFLSNFEFAYEDLLRELPQEVILLFHSFIEPFEKREHYFFETLQDNKKWDSAFKKYAHYKVKAPQFEQYFAEVCEFFSKHNSTSLLYEIASYFSIASYETDGESNWFIFDDFDGEPIPFTAGRIVDKGIQFHSTNGDKFELSPQALLCVRLFEGVLTSRLKSFKLKATLDDTMPPHAQLLLNTCHDAQKANVYFITLKQPLTSLIEVVVSYYKLFRFLEDAYAGEKDGDVQLNMSTYYTQLSQQLYRIASTCYLYYTNGKREQDKKTAASAKKRLEETVEKLDKQKEQTNELRKQQKEWKKQQKELSQKPVQIVSQADEQELKQLAEQLSKMQQAYTTLKKEKVCEEDKLQQEIQQLKEANSTLNKKLHPLLKVTSQPKIETIAQWLELGRELIQNITDLEEQQIREFFDLFLQVCDEQKAQKPKQERASNLFGYVSVGADGHYVNFTNGKQALISAIPASIYLAEGQFVQVTKDFEYVQDYPDFFDFQLNGQTACFSIVKMKDDIPYVFCEGELKPVTHETYIQLRDGQIVSFNKQLELIRFYKQKRFQLNVFEQSIKLKKHHPYYVQKALPTGIVVTHAFTKAESFITLANAENLQDDQFITVDGDDIVRSFHGSFYKLSSYYNKSEIVAVCEIDDVYFGKKLSREIVIIKNIPLNIKLVLGDAVRIDEGHNYLEIMREETVETETLEKRLARRTVTTAKENVIAVTPPSITSSVLIVGNPALFESYKQLHNYGYEVEAIDGYESFSRVKQAAKDKDLIVVCTGFASHDNMYAIKDIYPAQQVIYAEREGATQIALQLKSSNL